MLPTGITSLLRIKLPAWFTLASVGLLVGVLIVKGITLRQIDNRWEECLHKRHELEIKVLTLQNANKTLLHVVGHQNESVDSLKAVHSAALRRAEQAGRAAQLELAALRSRDAAPAPPDTGLTWQDLRL